MEDFELEDVMDLSEDDLDYEGDFSEADYPEEIFDMVADSELDYEDEDEDGDYDESVDGALSEMVNADYYGEEEHGDLVGGMALGALIRRRRNKKKAKELARQRKLRNLVKKARGSSSLMRTNSRSIAAIRRLAAQNRSRSMANSVTVKRLQKVAASNSRRISKASSAASKANTVNRVQNRRIGYVRKIQKTDGALDFSRSLGLERDDNGNLSLSVDVVSALKGATKHGWLGTGRGVLGNSAAIGAIGFLANNLTTIFPQQSSNLAMRSGTNLLVN